MNEPLDELYFNWLCAKVLVTRYPIYNDLMRILYQTEFLSFVANDQNRIADGLELREVFLRESRLEDNPDWVTNDPCSVLEVLIAFANRANFQTDIPARDWFWEFMSNLGLDEYRRVSRRDTQVVGDILYTFVHRTYSSDGRGGIFPLMDPRHDQRTVEIWYQFSEYLDDRGLA